MRAKFIPSPLAKTGRFWLPLVETMPSLRQGYGLAGAKSGQTWLPRGCSLLELSSGVTPPPVRLGPLFELAADPRPLVAVRQHPYAGVPSKRFHLR